MSNLLKRYAAIEDGRQVHYHHRRGAAGPIVFLHQTASSGRMFLKAFDRLGSAWECLAFDTPGFGGSFDPPAEERPSIGDYADWLHEAIAAAGVVRFHLVGHHTGASIAVDLAARRPELVKSLTLVGPVLLAPNERLEFSKLFGQPFTPKISGAHLLENWEYLRALGADRDVGLLHREMIDMLRAWQGRVQAYAAVWDHDFTACFERVVCPMLVMAAPDDVLFPYLSRALASRPEVSTLQVSGANFEPDLDADAFSAGVAAFCAAHDPA